MRRSTFLIVFLLAAAFPALALASNDLVVTPAVSADYSQWSLVTQTLDGVVTNTLPVPVAPTGGFQMLPDGSAVFAGDPSSPGIWLARPGQEALQLTNGPDTDPTATPDASKVAFVRGNAENDTPDIYVINGDGTGLTKLTDSKGLALYSDPEFSPDGSTIAYACVATVAAYDSGNPLRCGPQLDGQYWYTGVALMNADGTNKRLVQRAQTSDIAWSPDGQWLATIATIGAQIGQDQWTGYFELYVVKSDGSDLFADQHKERFVKVSDDPLALVPFGPSFSPDGNKLVFWASVPAENNNFPYVVNRDASGLRRLTLQGFPSPQFLPAPGGGGPPPTVDATHIVVPQVGGLSLAAAKQKLEAIHLNVVALQKRYSRTVPKGSIVGIQPASGTRLHRLSETRPGVTLYISRGPHGLRAAELKPRGRRRLIR